ncbi:hypothetical protein BO85DRAFT_439631 [Aspergillus piperis CBS 112811]|uniref:Uncharacterized protein n=1 Tax=Aspergillus piperis CBS 112811 TaxID=1448313 RepID=A0A8G1QZP1_9EURO|nr:hypothetical protein BO85DRAFT_439631 [Aspergillus piperis CBS 112811]RAH56522.1 hypothetical protein BO85DRAFT_439631 [Aspergillus piperis CBS 112811]
MWWQFDRQKGSDETGSSIFLSLVPVEAVVSPIDFSYDLPKLLAEFHQCCLHHVWGSTVTSPEKFNRLYISILSNAAMTGFILDKILLESDDEAPRFYLYSSILQQHILTGKIARQQREQDSPAFCFSITTWTNDGLHNIIPTLKALFYYYRKVVVEQASKLEKARAASLADSRMMWWTPNLRKNAVENIRTSETVALNHQSKAQQSDRTKTRSLSNECAFLISTKDDPVNNLDCPSTNRKNVSSLQPIRWCSVLTPEKRDCL